MKIGAESDAVSLPADAPPEEAGTAAPDVSIIVVSYNTREMTIECLRSVVERTRAVTYELIVLDNASTDGSAEAIAATFPDVHLISLHENIGFGRANNVAARAARGSFLLLLNPDTLLRDDAVAGILAFARRRPGARIWGGRTLFADGSLNPTSCFRDPTLWSLFCQVTGLNKIFSSSELFNPEHYGNWAQEREREVEIVTGCFFLIARRFWEELGGFDPDYFIYAEEADLCHRARLRGARPTVSPEVAIVHHGGASQKARGPRIVRLFRGKATFIRKHWRGPRRRLGLLLLAGLPLVRSRGYRLAAALTGRPEWRETASEWDHVFRHRTEWLAGFPPAPPGPWMPSGQG